MNVDVIEMMERVLAGWQANISAFLLTFMKIILGFILGDQTGNLAKDGAFSGIRLNDDSIIDAELLVVGIGVLNLSVAAMLALLPVTALLWMG